jgi:hypothetical protein
LAGESGGGAGSEVEVENDSLTRVNMSRDYWRLLESSCSASERACEQGKRAARFTALCILHALEDKTQNRAPVHIGETHFFSPVQSAQQLWDELALAKTPAVPTYALAEKCAIPAARAQRNR